MNLVAPSHMDSFWHIAGLKPEASSIFTYSQSADTE